MTAVDSEVQGLDCVTGHSFGRYNAVEFYTVAAAEIYEEQSV